MKSLNLIGPLTIFVLFIIVAVSGHSQKSLFKKVANAFESPVWGFGCAQNLCVKTKITSGNINSLQSFEVCRLTCGEDIGTLWPIPRIVSYNGVVDKIDPNRINFIMRMNPIDPTFRVETENRILEQVKNKQPKNFPINSGGRALNVDITVSTNNLELTMNTIENYEISTSVFNNDVLVQINAPTYFGAMHAMETLVQLIVYDNINNDLKVAINCKISDMPTFKHRGVMLDTSRNFFDKESILRTIDGLAQVKMNVFHWHITDSQSFPIIIKSQPDLARFGAYSPEKVYTPEDVLEIVKYAKYRGVRVIPEFDAPAHVGEGWEQKNLTTCFNMQPWIEFCVEPPCGQFDPSKDELYDALEDVYREYWENFGPMDIFHMGGDEVSFTCWNTSKELQDWMLNKGWGLEEKDFMKLWNYFQVNALARFDKVSNSKIPIILWTSTLTEEPYLTQYLDKDRYVIQIWTTGDDPKVAKLLENGYRVIISNYDALYLDCGFAGWVTDGNNWCSPYIGWQKIYENKISNIVGNKLHLAFGAEAALWSEQADDSAVDSLLWPRLSALAERLWSDPVTSWKNADSRMLMNHRRLLQNGIGSDRLQPEWCTQNEGDCPI